MDRALTGLAVVLLVAAAVALWRYAGPDEGPTPLTIESVQGDVARDRGDLSAHASIGMAVQPGDRLVTGPASTATLSRGGRSPITVDSETTVSVARVEDGLVELNVVRGSVKARVRPDGGALRLVNEGRAVLATDANLTVAVDAEGGFAVAAEEGQVAVSGVEGVGELGPHAQAVVLPGGAVRTGPIPNDVLLDVAWPPRGAVEHVTVEGHTEPGASVRIFAASIAGPVRADADGHFSLPVTLKEGENEVEVAVVDAFGRERRTRTQLIRDTKGPTFKVEIQYERERR